MKEFFLDFRKRLKSIRWVEFIILSAIAVVLFLVDLFSKQYVYHKYYSTYLQNPYFSVTAIPYLFNVTLAFNKGAAWSVGYGMVGLFSMISLIAGLALIFFFLYSFSKVSGYIRVCLALAIAGDFGNLVDRFGCWMQKGIYKEGVIDFITFDFMKNFPTFNLADSYLVIAIFIAIIGMIVTLIQTSLSNRKDETEEVSDSGISFDEKLSRKQNESDKDHKE